MLEAAAGAHARTEGGAMTKMNASWIAGQPLSQVGDDRLPRSGPERALRTASNDREDRRRIEARCVKVAPGKPAKPPRGHARRLARDARCSRTTASVRASDAPGQLHGDDDVALVLAGMKPCGTREQEPAGAPISAAIDQQHDDRVPRHEVARPPRIPGDSRSKPRLKRRKNPSKQRAMKSSAPAALIPCGLQQQGRERRRERQRDEAGDDRGDGNGHGELLDRTGRRCRG